MKKFALAMCAVLALSATASAGTATIGTNVGVSVSGSVTSTNGAISSSASNSLDNQLTVSVAGKGDNWSGSAALGALGAGSLALGAYQVDAKDGKFALTVWGNKELSDKATPFGYITSAKAGGDWKARASYDIVTLDVAKADPSVYAFAEKAIGTLTLGGAYNTNLKGGAADGASVIDGYVKTQVGPAAVTGEVALRNQTGVNGDNTKLGAKADVAVTGDVQAYGEFQSSAKNWGDSSTIIGKLTYKPMSVWGKVTLTTADASKDSLSKSTLIEANQTKDFTKFYGSMKNVADKAGKATGKVLNFQGVYSTVKGPDFDHFYNVSSGDYAKYYSYNGLIAGLWYTSDGLTNPTNTIAVRATSPVIPGKAWVVGAFQSTSDADGGQSIAVSGVTLGGGAAATSKTTIDVDGRYLLNSKVTLTGAFKAYSSNGDSYSQIYGKADYAMASALSLNASLKQESSNKEFTPGKKGVQTLSAGFSISL